MPFLVHETYRACISEGNSLQGRYAQIYPQLGKTGFQSDQHRESNDGRILDPTNATDAAENPEHHPPERRSVDHTDSTAIGIFYDRISRLSLDDSSLSPQASRELSKIAAQSSFEFRVSCIIYSILRNRSQSPGNIFSCEVFDPKTL